LEINNYAKRAPILIWAITKKTYSGTGIYNKLRFHDLVQPMKIGFLNPINQGLIMHEMEALIEIEIGKFSIFLMNRKLV
jgi:hypothetical protein